jgi:hypothetical protein
MSGFAGDFRSPLVSGSSTLSCGNHLRPTPPNAEEVMKKMVHWMRHALVALAVASLMAGCADQAPLGPENQSGIATSSAAVASTKAGPVDLGPCPDLQVEAGHEFVMRVYARGFQIYHWTGTAWAFDGPLADLSSDPEGRSLVGTHFSGPTWKSLSGSEVKGSILKRCTPSPDDIQWLLLGQAGSKGPGVFNGISFIQRLNTQGGIAPSYNGEFVGQEKKVPYTTEYVFYRPE